MNEKLALAGRLLRLARRLLTASSATYTKLRSGDWGLRVVGGTPKAGQSVHVKKKDGTLKVETVDRVLWSDGSVALCSIRPSASPGASSYGRKPGYGRKRECAECGEWINSPNQQCWETGGYCFPEG